MQQHTRAPGHKHLFSCASYVQSVRRCGADWVDNALSASRHVNCPSRQKDGSRRSFALTLTALLKPDSDEVWQVFGFITNCKALLLLQILICTVVCFPFTLCHLNQSLVNEKNKQTNKQTGINNCFFLCCTIWKKKRQKNEYCSKTVDRLFRI